MAAAGADPRSSLAELPPIARIRAPCREPAPPMRFTKTNDGFTLSELIVVLLLLAILAGVLVPRVTDRLAAARDGQRLSDLRRLRDAIERYYLDRGSYPPPAIST
jgi:prepilin-type N-terminal cleavage/methylation domain-containing protein